MERVVSPAPAGSAAAQGIPVIGLEGSPDIQEVGFDGIPDNHNQFVHGESLLFGCFFPGP
jgi:hypothetical protein